MTIFFNNSKGTVAIPYGRIYEISQHGNIISISYDGGEMTWLDEEKFVKKISVDNIFFDNENFANNQMRGFYKACENNKGAFFFG